MERIILATNYTLRKYDECGHLALEMSLDGEERFKTTCYCCGKDFEMSFKEFFAVAATEFCFFGSHLHCDECSPESAEKFTHKKEDVNDTEDFKKFQHKKGNRSSSTLRKNAHIKK